MLVEIKKYIKDRKEQMSILVLPHFSSIHAVSVVRTNRKSIVLQWCRGKWLVRAPLEMDDRDICRFLEVHREWIEKKTELFSHQWREKKELVPFSKEELDALKEQASGIIPLRVAYYAEKLGVTYGKITIRSQRTRWGSCSAKGNLSFNCLLMLAPMEVLDSVVVHELCHRKVMNHSPYFYREVQTVLPDYRQRAAWLKENGERLIGRLGIE